MDLASLAALVNEVLREWPGGVGAAGYSGEDGGSEELEGIWLNGSRLSSVLSRHGEDKTRRGLDRSCARGKRGHSAHERRWTP